MAAKQERALDDVVDELGVGVAQYRILVSGGAPFFLSGAIKMLIGVLAVTLTTEWALSTTQQATLVSVLFVGQMLGNLVAGVFADWWGRRNALLLAVLLTTLFSMSSAFSSGFLALLGWRAAIGFSLGFGAPPFNAISSEMCSSAWRPEMFALGNVIFCLGMICTLGLVWWQDPDMVNLQWRQLTVLAALPGLLLLLVAYFWLPESLRFLDRTSSREEVIVQLEKMRELNSRPEVDCERWTSGESMAEKTDSGLGPIWSRQLRFSTITLCTSTLTMNYVYYGQLYALPQLLPEMNLGVPAAGMLLIATCVEIVGYSIAVALGRRTTRKMVLLISFLGVAIGMLIFTMLVRFRPVTNQNLFVILSSATVCIMRLFCAVLWLFVYLYSTEVYPTSCRASGSAIAVAFGRIGSIGCPFAFEILHHSTGTHDAFFIIGAVLAAANSVLVAMLPLETKDRQLGEIAAESRSII